MAAESPISTSSNPRRKLGRGLGSLISTPVQVQIPSQHPTSQPPPTQPTRDYQSPEPDPNTSELQDMDLALIQPNPNQPRQNFDENALLALAASITTSGLMQPIVVRMSDQVSGGYQIIAGERRWRAAQMAGLTRIPVVIRNVDDRTAAELSLVENIQREDLNPMERAEAFLRLLEDYQLTHEEIAQQVGLDRSSITNHLRLHDLDDATKQSIRTGDLTMGHAKALLAITSIQRRSIVARQVAREGWSVRELERRLKTINGDFSSSAPAAVFKPAANSNTADLERRLGEHLGTRVQVRPGKKKGTGRLIIEFFDLDQFDGLMRRMQFEND